MRILAMRASGHTQENMTDCGRIPAAASDRLEREIPLQVYALYGLTPEKIKIVEAAATAH